MSEVLLPFVVNDEEQHAFLKLLHYLLAMRLCRLFEVNGDIIDLLTVRDRDEDILVHLTLGLVDILDHRIGNLRQLVHTTFEAVECRLSQLFTQHLALTVTESVLIKRHLNRKSLHRIELQPLVVISRTGIGKDILCRLVDHIRDIHTDTLSHEGVTTLGVNEVTLLVHHIVVLNQTLTDTEVILLHFLLRTLDRAGDHVVLDHFAILEAHAVHHPRNTLRTEHTHQVVFETHIEDRTTRVTLTTGTTT